jgi:hypothetical protein
MRDWKKHPPRNAEELAELFNDVDRLEEEYLRALIEGRKYLNDPKTRWRLHKLAMTSPERMRAYQKLVEFTEGSEQ